MGLNSGQTTKNHIHIAHIGLGARDVLAVESMFRLQPALQNRFLFGVPTAADPADLVLVNADDRNAVADWERQKADRPDLIAIMVAEHGRVMQGQICLRRPLDVNELISTVEALTTADTMTAGQAATASGDNTLNILVVDDSFPARQFMKFKLESLASRDVALRIDFADNGEKALEAASAQPYDLIFLDVVMPGMDGYETCSRLKKIRPSRVAMLTSLNMPADFQRGREAGCDYYIPKPPNESDLKTILSISSFRKLTTSK